MVYKDIYILQSMHYFIVSMLSLYVRVTRRWDYNKAPKMYMLIYIN